MAEDMIERAAKAIWETWSERVRWDERREFHKDETRKEARAALLAALDPEDKAARERMAKRIFLGRTHFEHDSVVAQRWLKEREGCLRDAENAMLELRSIINETAQGGSEP